MVSDRVRLVGVGLLAGLFVLVWIGPGMTASESQHDAETLVREAVHSVESESIAGIRVRTIRGADAERQMKVAVQRAPPHRSRLRVLGSSTDSGGPQITIVNRSTVWQYNERESRAIRYEKGRSLFSSGFTAGNTDQILEEYTTDYEGTTQYRNRTVHIVELMPPEDESVSLSIDVSAGGKQYNIPLTETKSGQTWHISRETWWIDNETSYPMKKQIKWINDDGDVVATTETKYTDLTLDPQLSNETFSLRPTKEDIEQIEIAESHVYQNRSSARNAVPFDIPEPKIPSGYSLQHATARSYDNEDLLLWDASNESTQMETESYQTVVLAYSDGVHSLRIEVSKRHTIPDNNQIVEQGVGKFNGEIVVLKNRATVVRDCSALSYRISGSPNIDTLIAIGESMSCSA